jgi:uracil-DNA glycosylase
MILFIGDKPSSKMRPNARPFEGAACEKRLMEWIRFLGIESDGYVLLNQSDWPNTLGWLTVALVRKYPVIALGNTASRYISARNPHFKLPHPSGRNRQINDKVFINSKLEECKKYIKGF